MHLAAWPAASASPPAAVRNSGTNRATILSRNTGVTAGNSDMAGPVVARGGDSWDESAGDDRRDDAGDGKRTTRTIREQSRKYKKNFLPEQFLARVPIRCDAP